MIFSYKWLSEYVDITLSADELAERLTMSGIEVDSVAPFVEPIKNLYAARIDTMESHPNADKLSVCGVTSSEGSFSIVCGAKNMAVGDFVVLSRPGAVLPGNFKIKKSKIRGVASEGMLCSESELGIADTSAGIMVIDGEIALDTDMNKFLGFDDYKIEIDITPNRPDLYNVVGMAREIAAITGVDFKGSERELSEGDRAVSDYLTVENRVPSVCKRYMARVITGLKVAPSPLWLQKRLLAHDVRPINNVVDATNYILLELGQPLHAFDLKKLGVAGHLPMINVRNATSAEEITTLDGKLRVLSTDTLAICDASSPQAIAGVMGGADSEVSDATTDIVLEAASFDRASVRRASRRLGLSTSSSFIFERGLDTFGVAERLDHAAALLVELAGGTVAKGALDSYPEPTGPRTLSFSAARAKALLGVELDEAEAVEIFTRLGLEAHIKGDKIEVIPPPYRDDLVAEIDLVEEVARMRGYDRLPTTLPRAPFALGKTEKSYRLKKLVKQSLVSAGFNEVKNYSFVSRELFELALSAGESAVRVANPLSEEQSVMRTSLLPSLLENMRRNLARSHTEARLFELAPAFLKGSPERLKVAGIIYGSRLASNWSRQKESLDFFDLKGIIEKLLSELAISLDSIKFNPGLGGNVSDPASDEASGVEGGESSGSTGKGARLLHPGESANLVIKGKEAGILGRLHPEVGEGFDIDGPAFIFELEFDLLLAAYDEQRSFSGVNRYPASSRDIAFVIDDSVPYGNILESISKNGTKIIENVELFDVYYGEKIEEGKKSLGVRIKYRLKDRTLKQSEIEKAHSRISSMIIKDFGAEIRA